jgi:outer membrane protein OmpA-like peptidoglycan-associated protein
MRSTALAIGLSAVVFSSGRGALAETAYSIHVEGAAARAVGATSGMFGWGGSALITPELVLHPMIGIELPLGVIGLATNPDANPAFARTPSGSTFLALSGIRVRPLRGRWGGLGDGLWIAGGGGLADTAGVLAPALDARLGVDLQIGSVSVGPFAGYLQVVDVTSGARPGDARVALFGLHGAFGPRPFPARRAPAPEPSFEPSPPPSPIGESPDAAPLAELGPTLDPPPPASAPPTPAPAFRELVEPIRFVFHRAEITREGMLVVLAAAELLRERPDIKVARVVGHSDELGDTTYNLRLSEARAQAVVAALIRQGVDPHRLEVTFLGKSQPRRRGLGERAQQENRRVEIQIVNEAALPHAASEKGVLR